MKALTDEMLATLAQTGDARAADALMRRYESTARGEASQFYFNGHDVDDVRQEARVGLLRAIREFNVDKGVPFGAYAHMSIRRQLITAVKTANRAKHGPLTDSVRHDVTEDGEVMAIVELIPTAVGDPHETLVQRDEIRRLGRALRVFLSPVEASVLILWANGYEYDEIAARTGRSWKTVDTALTRARYKLSGVGPSGVPLTQRTRREYVCPSCGHETVRVGIRGNERRGPGRPPLCNVCTTRKAAA